MRQHKTHGHELVPGDAYAKPFGYRAEYEDGGDMDTSASKASPVLAALSSPESFGAHPAS